MRNMLDRVYDRRRRLGIHDDDKQAPADLNARIERELQREDEAAAVRNHADGRRSETTGY